MYADDPNYKPHLDDKDFSLLEPHNGILWRMALIYLVNHQPMTWEYGICAAPSGQGSVMPVSADNLKAAIGEELFAEATQYIEAKAAQYFADKKIPDPRLVKA